MKTNLFNDSKVGIPTVKRLRNGIRTQRNQPEFRFEFCLTKGLSRADIEPWQIRSISHQEISINLAALSSWAGRPLSPLETDWVGVALAIYSADRFAPRRPGGVAGGSYWSRAISLKVAVADPRHWNSAKDLLLNALTFLTDDDWSLEFTQRDQILGEELQQLFGKHASDTPSWICLFSGGLDSLAGFRHLARQVGGKGLLVSGWTNERLRCGQSDIISKLADGRGDSFEWLQVGYGFPKIINSQSMESTQRSRGWVHVALGLVSAAISKCDSLYVCENGIGALNLPTELSQTGSHSSRAVHPVFLHRIAMAASKLFGRDLTVRQPALFDTKAQLLRSTLQPFDEALIHATFSCEIFPNFNSKQPQCGVCPSCLVRRAALHSAGLPDKSSGYTVDVLSRAIPSRKDWGLTRMHRYVNRIEKCCGVAAMSDAVMWEYPEAGSYFEEAARSLDLELSEFLLNVRRLHQEFANEWTEFSNSLPHNHRISKIAA